MDIDKYKLIDIYEDPGSKQKLFPFFLPFKKIFLLKNRRRFKSVKAHTKESFQRHRSKMFGSSEAFRMLSIPDVSNSPCVLHELIGEGGFSKVYRCSLGPIMTAVKIYNMKTDNQAFNEKTLIKESKLVMPLRHENIVACLGYQCKVDSFWIFLEYIGGGTMWNLLHEVSTNRENFNVSEVLYYAVQVVRGIDYLHSKKVYHRDLKSSNIVLDGQR